MAQSAFFLFTFVIAGSVFQLVRLWDSSIENQLMQIRRNRKLLKQKQGEERHRREQEARWQYRSYQSQSRQQNRRTYERPSNASRHPTNIRDFYCEILGIEEGAAMSDIKKTYRQMVAKYHPDKVQHLGPEFQDLAEKKIKELNEAYDFFKRRF